MVIGYAIAHVHRRLNMTSRHWFAFRVGSGHVRAHYLRDIGASAAFTVSDIIAYNAPYFTIAAVTSDARPMLVFDFFFKMSRSLSMQSWSEVHIWSQSIASPMPEQPPVTAKRGSAVSAKVAM
jgi:hypothetical protein